MGPGPSRSGAMRVRRAAAAHRDDLGADRHRRLLGRARPDVQADRAHQARPQLCLVGPGLEQPRPALRRACAASPSPRCSRRWCESRRARPGRRTWCRGSARTPRRAGRARRRRARGSGRASPRRPRRRAGNRARVAKTGRASQTVTAKPRTLATSTSARVKSTAPKMMRRAAGANDLDEHLDVLATRLTARAVVARVR